MANSVAALNFLSSSSSSYVILAYSGIHFGNSTRVHKKLPSKIHPRRSCLVGSKSSCSPIITAMRIEKPLEELYKVRVERGVSPQRLEELGVSRWSIWKTGKCRLPWDWHVDQLVYIEEGEVRVVPEGSRHYMRFVAGDLVRYPKWFEADLFFNGRYQERYRFRAYGDD